jgi:peptide/nickel transport system substrate-binding protein
MRGDRYWERLNRRRLLAGAGATSLGAWFAACRGRNGIPATGGPSGTPSASGAPQKGGMYNYYHVSNMPLDPQKVSSAPQVGIGGVYSRIFRWKTGLDTRTIEDHAIENDLAAEIETPDPSTWTVKLRQDVKFHSVAPVSGRALDSEDVKSSFTRLLDPATNSPNRTIVDMIDPAKISMPDKYTVTFQLRYPYSPFPHILASSAFGWILPREAATGGVDPSKQVIGTGPFTTDQLTPDIAYTYKRNPDYFDKSIVPNIDGFKMAIIADTATQYAQFTAGNLDEQLIVNPFDVDSMKRQNPKAQVSQVPYNSGMPLYFQMGDPNSAFKDIRVRRAFSMAVDRNTINKALYNGQGGQTIYVPGYMGKWAVWTQDLPKDVQQWWTYDPANAKKMLAVAGADNLDLRVGYLVPTNPTNMSELQSVASYLNAIGVKTTLVPQDYNKDFVDDGHGTRQGFFPKDFVGFLNQSPYEEADFWFFNYFYSRSASNQEHLNDPKFDAMVDHQRTIVDENERVKAVRDIQVYMADQCLAPNFPGGSWWIFVQPRVQNYQWSNSFGEPTESFARLWLSS